MASCDISEHLRREIERIFNSKNYLFKVVNLPAIKKAYRPATNKEQWAEGKGWHVFHRGRLFLELRPKCTRIACYSPSDRLRCATQQLVSNLRGGSFKKVFEYEHPKCTYNFNIAVERKESGVLERENNARGDKKKIGTTAHSTRLHRSAIVQPNSKSSSLNRNNCLLCADSNSGIPGYSRDSGLGIPTAATDDPAGSAQRTACEPG